MNSDVVTMIFFGLLALGFLLAVVGLLLSSAYRLGFMNGEIRERLRWHEVGVDRRIEEEKAEEFLTKLDI
jgi:hypothetical protein